MFTFVVKQSGKSKSHAVQPIPTRQQKQARIQARIAEASTIFTLFFDVTKDVS
jgi:hypothetical protein